MPKKTKRSPYEFFGAPEYDPRKENRFKMEPSGDREADIAKVTRFVDMALRKNAGLIQIISPTRSGRPDSQFELYSDAGIDAKTFQGALRPKRKKNAKR